jgi:hypothetical protein
MFVVFLRSILLEVGRLLLMMSKFRRLYPDIYLF